jgi:hypothetical protein
MITIINNNLEVYMNSAKATIFYNQQIKMFSRCKGMHSAQIVAQFIEASLTLARCYSKEDCILLQELFLRRTYHDLINKICDPLQSECMRKQCLDQLYKPLLALKRFYKKYDSSQKKYYELERELRVLSHEFNPY